MTSNNPTTRQASDSAAAGEACLPQYEIRIHGHFGSRWAAWFEGLDLTAEDDGTTVLRGPVVDQSALHGLLAKLRDLGIPLVSLTELPPERPTELSDLGAAASSHQPPSHQPPSHRTTSHQPQGEHS